MFVVRHWHLYAITIFAGIAFILGVGVWVDSSTLVNSACATEWFSDDQRFYLFLGNGDGALHYISDYEGDFTDCKIVGPNSTVIDVRIDEILPGFRKGTIAPPANITSLEWRTTRNLLFSRTYLFRVNITSIYGNLTLALDSPCKKPKQ